MKAIVWHDVGDIRLDDVPEPRIQDPYDALVQITTSAICGTDLHFVRGTMSGMRPGTVLGHEAVGTVTEVGSGVRNLRPGQRVVIPSTIGCGSCSYCRSGYYSQCVVDGHADRLEAARRLGGEAVDFNQEDPVEVLHEITGGTGPDRVIDAVGVDAERPKTGPAAGASDDMAEGYDAEVAQNSPRTGQQGQSWKPGDAPSQAARWYVDAIAKAGTISVIGVYPVASGLVDPSTILTQERPLAQGALDAYETFDRREPGWIKTVLTVGSP